MTNIKDANDVLAAAARVAGLATTGVQLIRDGSNMMYQLPGDIVARVGRPGSKDVAQREMQVAHWLSQNGIRAVQPVPSIPQAIIVDDRPVTWWELIPEHRPATPAELAIILSVLHRLPIPDHPHLPTYNPFDSLRQRITNVPSLSDEDRAWLIRHLEYLHEEYGKFPAENMYHVIHGDAWQGNVAVPEAGEPILMDLEVVSIGSPDWDLIQIAVDFADFDRIDAEEYRSFVQAYGGYDVTTSASFRILADIQELRWVCFALSKYETNADAAREAQHRLACIRGEVQRPWSWTAI